MSNEKYILGIETSCDDTSVALIKESGENREILFHKRYGQEDILASWGGVVPEIAARNHLAKLPILLKESFRQTKIELEKLDLIAVTTLPGLLGPLLTGVNAAKTLSLFTQCPIVPVNHLYAHLEAIHLTEKISYPYLGLLISGGHSIYFWVESATQFKVLGSTIDDAVGEAFDKGGKLLKLGYPAGHIIDKLGSFGDPLRFEFPIGLKSSADARLSFSGLKTSLRNFIEKHPEILKQKPTQYNHKEATAQDFYDLCASYQHAIAQALLLKMKYALKKVAPVKGFPIVLGGGVACNSYLRKKFQEKYSAVYFVKPEFCTDNGAMIANYGAIHLNRDSLS